MDARAGFAVIAVSASEMEATPVVSGLADNPHPIESASRHGCRDALLTSATARDVVEALEGARRPAPQPAERPVAASDLGTRRRADAARLLHLAASDAAVEALPSRCLGVVERERRAEHGERLRAPAG